MTPIEPKVARVSRRPRCVECAETEDLIGRAPRFVCRSCVRIKVRLAEAGRRVASHDDDVREGWRP